MCRFDASREVDAYAGLVRGDKLVETMRSIRRQWSISRHHKKSQSRGQKCRRCERERRANETPARDEEMAWVRLCREEEEAERSVQRGWLRLGPGPGPGPFVCLWADPPITNPAAALCLGREASADGMANGHVCPGLDGQASLDSVDRLCRRSQAWMRRWFAMPMRRYAVPSSRSRRRKGEAVSCTVLCCAPALSCWFHDADRDVYRIVGGMPATSIGGLQNSWSASSVANLVSARRWWALKIL